MALETEFGSAIVLCGVGLRERAAEEECILNQLLQAIRVASTCGGAEVQGHNELSGFSKPRSNRRQIRPNSVEPTRVVHSLYSTKLC